MHWICAHTHTFVYTLPFISRRLAEMHRHRTALSDRRSFFTFLVFAKSYFGPEKSERRSQTLALVIYQTNQINIEFESSFFCLNKQSAAWAWLFVSNLSVVRILFDSRWQFEVVSSFISLRRNVECETEFDSIGTCVSTKCFGQPFELPDGGTASPVETEINSLCMLIIDEIWSYHQTEFEEPRHVTREPRKTAERAVLMAILQNHYTRKKKVMIDFFPSLSLPLRLGIFLIPFWNSTSAY